MPLVFDKVFNIIRYVNDTSNKSRYVLMSHEELNRLELVNFKKMLKYTKNAKLENKYIHVTMVPLSDDNYLDFYKDTYNSIFGKRSVYYNPEGIWIACGTSWIDFIENNYLLERKRNNNIYSWTLATFIYEIKVNETVLKINNIDEFVKFISKFRNKDKTDIRNVIDWKKVKATYNGLIICPYLGDDIFGKNASAVSVSDDIVENKNINEFYKKLLGKNYNKHIVFLAEWYRHWSVSSGVVWDKNGITDVSLIKRIGTFDNYRVKEKK